MNQHPIVFPAADATRARYALRVAARLSEQSEALPPDLAERLRFARERALERSRVDRAGHSGHARAVARTAGIGLWWRLAAFAPGLALIAGLVLIQWQQDDEQLQVTADIDAELLADELPPLVYADPGFAEFLKSPGS